MKSKTLDAGTDLRRRAELTTLERKSGNAVPRTDLDSQRLLHELEVHQIELEMQNAELRLARDEAEAAREKYSDLYDFAPVGYFTLSPDDRIRMVNLTGASMLGIERSRLLGKSFASHIAPDQRDDFTRILQQVFDEGGVLTMDLKLLSKKQPAKVACLNFKRSLDGLECNLGMVDITERIHAESIQHRLEVMAASNHKLEREIVRRQKVEEKLHETEYVQSRLLEHSIHQQAELRNMSHKILHAQEDERKRISRELHDVIAQTLAGIHIHVAALAHKNSDDHGGLQQRIANTQQIVESSMKVIHQFALELRPTVLDDLGLIPALEAFLKDFTETSGIRVSLEISSTIDEASESIRTTFFRIIQEALMNVAQHAKASKVHISIQCLDDGTSLQITDDGHGFEMEEGIQPLASTRLGLLGMKERAEMVGGVFSVDTASGRSTTLRVMVGFHPIKKPGILQ